MKQRLFFYGDSNTWGYTPFGPRIDAQDRFPQQAATHLPGWEIVECGLNGRCTARSHDLFPSELLGGATFLAAFKEALPIHALVIMLGTNDVMDPLNFSANTIAENIRSMLHDARTLSPTLSLLVISPPAIAQRSVWELVGLYHCEKELLEQDLAGPLAHMAREEGADFWDARESVPEFGAEDGMHLTIEDHHRLGKACGAFLKKRLFS